MCCAGFRLVDLRGALLVGDRLVQLMSYWSSFLVRNGSVNVHLICFTTDFEHVVSGLFWCEVLLAVRRGAKYLAAKLGKSSVKSTPVRTLHRRL